MNYTEQIEQIKKLLGVNYNVKLGYEPCDVDIDLPKPIGGNVTICLAHKRWTPGGSNHANNFTGQTEWFGFDLYLNRHDNWIEKMCQNILGACRKYIETDDDMYYTVTSKEQAYINVAFKEL